MQQKVLVSLVAMLLITAIVLGWLFLRAKPTVAPAPTATLPTITETQPAATAPVNQGASVEDIAASIAADLSEDETVLDTEAAEVLGDITESKDQVNALGQSYDETQY